MKETEYNASGGREIFLSYENDALLGFLRLRLGKTARIRELHIYGEATPIGEGSRQAQHTGIGKQLMARAEQIAAEYGADKITVTSGVGVRRYYAKLGYVLERNYMARRIQS